MSEQDSAHDAFAEAIGGTATASQPEPMTAEAIPAPQEEVQTAAEPSAPAEQAQSPQAPPAAPQSEGMVPSWRLRERSEELERMAQARAAAERELNELRRWRQEQEQQARQRAEEEAARNAEFNWEDPRTTIDQRARMLAGQEVRQHVDPVRQQLEAFQQAQHQALIYNARLVATSVLGADKVAAAEKAFNEASQAGLIDPIEHRRINSSPNPFEAAVKWHERTRTLEQIGSGGLEGYQQKLREEWLKDPAFLQQAFEAHRQMATPVQTGVPGGRASSPSNVTRMPSLNRATAAADDGGAADPAAVWNQTIATQGRRPG
ncbi:hypothetical protein [Methylobacterium sp. Gmos1]